MVNYQGVSRRMASRKKYLRMTDEERKVHNEYCKERYKKDREKILARAKMRSKQAREYKDKLKRCKIYQEE